MGLLGARAVASPVEHRVTASIWATHGSCSPSRKIDEPRGSMPRVTLNRRGHSTGCAQRRGCRLAARRLAHRGVCVTKGCASRAQRGLERTRTPIARSASRVGAGCRSRVVSSHDLGLGRSRRSSWIRALGTIGACESCMNRTIEEDANPDHAGSTRLGRAELQPAPRKPQSRGFDAIKQGAGSCQAARAARSRTPIARSQPQRRLKRCQSIDPDKGGRP